MLYLYICMYASPFFNKLQHHIAKLINLYIYMCPVILVPILLWSTAFLSSLISYRVPLDQLSENTSTPYRYLLRFLAYHPTPHRATPHRLGTPCGRIVLSALLAPSCFALPKSFPTPTCTGIRKKLQYSCSSKPQRRERRTVRSREQRSRTPTLQFATVFGSM